MRICEGSLWAERSVCCCFARPWGLLNDDGRGFVSYKHWRRRLLRYAANKGSTVALPRNIEQWRHLGELLISLQLGREAFPTSAESPATRRRRAWTRTRLSALSMSTARRRGCLPFRWTAMRRRPPKFSSRTWPATTTCLMSAPMERIFKRLTIGGYHYRVAAENVGVGQRSFAQIIDGWKKEHASQPEHPPCRSEAYGHCRRI